MKYDKIDIAKALNRQYPDATFTIGEYGEILDWVSAFPKPTVKAVIVSEKADRHDRKASMLSTFAAVGITKKNLKALFEFFEDDD